MWQKENRLAVGGKALHAFETSMLGRWLFPRQKKREQLVMTRTHALCSLIRLPCESDSCLGQSGRCSGAKFRWLLDDEFVLMSDELFSAPHLDLFDFCEATLPIVRSSALNKARVSRFHRGRPGLIQGNWATGLECFVLVG